MQSRKRNKSIFCIVLAFCLLIGGLLTGKSPTGKAQAANVESQAIANTLTSISVMAAGTTEKVNVYDKDNNKLMYNRVTGQVFSEKGVVHTPDSLPITFDDNEVTFEDSLQRRLDLVEKSTNGLQNYYLMFGEYYTESISFDAPLLLVTIKANTKFNKGAAHDMLITYTRHKNSKWDYFWTGYKYFYRLHDLRGHDMDIDYIKTYTNTWNKMKDGYKFMDFTGKGWSKTTYLIAYEWGTVRDLLDEIIYLMEVVPPNGSPLGEFALNTVTGEFLRDDRNQKIRISKERVNGIGQLIDPMGWPLIGSDARPLWWDGNVYAYTTHNGEMLNWDENNILKQSDGFVAHSVISNVIAGMQIHLIYVNILDEWGNKDLDFSSKFLFPATRKTINTNPIEYEYYDLNGNLVSEREITAPSIHQDPSDPLDGIQSFFEEFKDFFSSIGNSISSVISGIVGFFAKFGKWIMIGILAIGVAILLSVFMPVLAPILSIFFKAIIHAIVFVIKVIVKGIAMILTAPVKLIQFLSAKEGT